MQVVANGLNHVKAHVQSSVTKLFFYLSFERDASVNPELGNLLYFPAQLCDFDRATASWIFFFF